MSYNCNWNKNGGLDLAMDRVVQHSASSFTRPSITTTHNSHRRTEGQHNHAPALHHDRPGQQPALGSVLVVAQYPFSLLDDLYPLSCPYPFQPVCICRGQVQGGRTIPRMAQRLHVRLAAGAIGGVGGPEPINRVCLQAIGRQQQMSTHPNLPGRGSPLPQATLQGTHQKMCVSEE